MLDADILCRCGHRALRFVMTKALFVGVDAHIDPRSAEPDQGSHFE